MACWSADRWPPGRRPPSLQGRIHGVSADQQAIDDPANGAQQDCNSYSRLSTSHSATTVSAVPSSVVRVMGSANNAQAISAVTGGVRYM